MRLATHDPYEVFDVHDNSLRFGQRITELIPFIKLLYIDIPIFCNKAEIGGILINVLEAACNVLIIKTFSNDNTKQSISVSLTFKCVER